MIKAAQVSNSLIYGIGTDIVNVARMRNNVARFGERFAQRLLTDAELPEYRASHQPERFLAKRFAAKEAVVKALGLGFRQGLTLRSVGVSHDSYGKPEVVYLGEALARIEELGISKSLISISDEWEYAVAFVILLGAGAASPAR